MKRSVPPVLSVRDAVLKLIKANAEINAACEGRIGAIVPTVAAVAKLPNVSCGPSIRARGENAADPLGMIRLRLFVASGKPMPDEAWTLAHAIGEAIEGAEPEIGGGFHLIDILRVTQSGDVIDRLSPNEVFIDIATIVQRD